MERRKPNSCTRDEARARYTEKYPQPEKHPDGSPTIKMPGGILNDHELDIIIAREATLEAVVDAMYATRGTPGIRRGF